MVNIWHDIVNQLGDFQSKNSTINATIFAIMLGSTTTKINVVF